jgi:RHS repeat-associated protein
VGVRNATGLTWQAGDSQGTSQLALRATDLALTRRRTDPWGNVRGAAVTWPTTRGFLNGVSDGTGLTHLGARDYDPVTGAFISVDPKLDTGDLEQMASYSYADNNPVTLADPDGRHVGNVCEGADNCGVKSAPPPPPADETVFQTPTKTWTETTLGPTNVHQVKHSVTVRIFKRKQIVMIEIRSCEGVPDGVAAPGATPTCSTSTETLGAVSTCSQGLDSSSPVCFVGADGYAHDLAGHTACAPAGSFNVCGGRPPVIDQGCGPGGSGPGGKPWPVTMGPTTGHEIHIKEEPKEFDCGRTDERCRLMSFVSKATEWLAYCPTGPCAVASLVGNATLGLYYIGQGRYYDAVHQLDQGLLVYGTHKMGGAASEYFFAQHGEDAVTLADWSQHYVTHPATEHIWDEYMPPSSELESEGDK